VLGSSRFISTWLCLRDMTEKPMLHKGVSGEKYDIRSSIGYHRCGAKIINKELTDKQALALETCPICFPRGFKVVDVRVEEEKPKEEGVFQRVMAKKGEWL